MLAARLRDFGRDLLRFLFPPICPLCSDRLDDDDQVICKLCRREIPQVLEPFCQRCGSFALTRDSQTCRLCTKMEPAFDYARAAAILRGPAEKMVHELKYYETWSLAPVMARLLQLCCERHLPFESFDAVVPVPLHPVRLRERGFNQAELIAAPFAEMLGKPLLNDVVARVRPTQSQTRLSLEERIENVKDAFEPLPNAADRLLDRNIALVDDVCTTGATGSACAKALKKGGAFSVVLLTFARASLE